MRCYRPANRRSNGRMARAIHATQPTCGVERRALHAT
jgi:hypothetical protein